jgi:hypothetical protein
VKSQYLYPEPSPVSIESSYTLPRNVSAFQILSPDSADQSRLGLMTQLPAGAQLDVRGPGFDNRTIRVSCAGAAYYVFLEDLEPQRKRVASAGL